jgi:hypothetical protein
MEFSPNFAYDKFQFDWDSKTKPVYESSVLTH